MLLKIIIKKTQTKKPKPKPTFQDPQVTKRIQVQT